MRIVANVLLKAPYGTVLAFDELWAVAGRLHEAGVTGTVTGRLPQKVGSRVVAEASKGWRELGSVWGMQWAAGS